MARRSPCSDGGETLLELLIAIAILGVVVAGVIGGLLTTVLMADIQAKQAAAGAYVRNYAEAVENFVAGTGYSACATAATYAPGTVGFTAPGYTASVTAVLYWNGTAWTSTCTVSTDSGVQQVTAQVASNDGRATERLVFVVRKPCGSGSTCG